jgi:hypothetical protein
VKQAEDDRDFTVAFTSENAAWEAVKGGTERNYGTVGANASAFVTGFQPLKAVHNKKSGDNSGRKFKHSLQRLP